MINKIIIPLPMASVGKAHRGATLNEYINAERSSRYTAANIKRQATELAMLHTKTAMNKGVQFDWPCKLKFTWYTKNKRQDPDNVAFQHKFILDGFQKAGFLQNDNRGYILGFVDDFNLDKDEPRVEVEVIK